MGKFVVTAPDGKQYEVNAPEGATEQQVMDYVKSNYQAQAPAPEEPGIGAQLARKAGLAGRAVVEGLSLPVNVAADFLSGAYNVGANLLGSQSRMPYMSQEQSKALTQLGLPEPQTGIERAVQAGMQSLVSAGGMAAAAPKTIFGADLARQLPAATAAPMVAQPVAEQTKELTGSDLAATIAGIGVSGAVGKAAGDLAGQITAGKRPVTTMADVEQRAGRAYTKVTDAGIELNQQSASNLVNKVKAKLDASDYLPETSKEVAATLNRYDSIVSGGNVSFNDVEQMRRLANGLKGSQEKNTRRLGNVMISTIDDYVAGLSPKDVASGAGGIDEAVKTIMSARKDWRNLSRATTLQDILDISEVKAMSPNASESELIRKGFINLAANKEKMRLFNPDEQNAIKAVASGGPLDDLLSFAARFNPKRSQLVAGGMMGTGITNPETLKYTVPAGVVGLSADTLQAVLRKRAADAAISGLLTGTTPPPAPDYFTRGLLSSMMNPPRP